MSIHKIAFWVCAFFLLGVFFISVFNSAAIVSISVLIISVSLIIFKKYNFSWLILFMMAGVFYYQAFDKVQRDVNIPFGKSVEIVGIVKELGQSQTSQKIVLELQSPYSGKIQATVKRYPDLAYGDLIKIKGVIENPAPESADYYAKNSVFGVMKFPNIESIEHGHGNSVEAALLSFKNKIISIFEKTLPGEKAAFLSGLTLGEREDFSKDFQNKMSLSGTTHLVALSGYNISIIAVVVAAILGGFLPAATSFYLTVLIIILFVLMTGAEASVVRAAIMGVIILLARRVEREYSLRNAIVITAFLMVLFNPRVLTFDIGFQLSFAALLGIVYLSPILKNLLRIKDVGILAWRENAVVTLSAQLAVIPLLLGNFGFFSLTSFFANILILPFVPFVMGLGFIMAGLGFISIFLARVIGLLANLILSYMLLIIDIFSKITLPVNSQSFGFVAGIIYYLILIGAAVYINKKWKNKTQASF